MMKKLAVVLLSIFFLCGSTAGIFAQSRRVTGTDGDGKANRREAKPAATPTPQPTPNDEQTAPTANTSATAETPVEDGEVINVNTDLVTIPVRISDRDNRFIAGLKKEDFKVFENDVEQENAYFSNEEQPFTVALVLDMSISTTFKINEIQNAAIAFTAQLRPKDKVLVVSFSQEVYVLCEATSDRQRIHNAIRSSRIESGTSLYEAVDMVINDRFKKISGRKAIVLFTDGVDTSSRRADAMKNTSNALELDALIYPVQYDTYNDVQSIKNKPIITQPNPTGLPIPPTGNPNPSPFPFPLPTIPTVGTPSGQGTSAEDYRKATEYLAELAARTGGRVHQASTSANLALAFSNIAAELRQLYSLGYYPKEEGKAGQRRKIKVRTSKPGLVVKARDSYVVGKKAKKS
ncbi:MAG TPA: VWA domain-containing protein [Pyrinomonadaceae bacterium]|nr:VWA domain-containing protein [Pyrinomonadaceae bacterium]